MTDSNLQELGVALRDARIEAGLSMRKAATAAGLNAASLLRLEAGSVERPRPAHLQTLARIYGTEVENFYAYAGFERADGLPELKAYLRSKYDLPAQTADQIDEYVQSIRSSLQLGNHEENRHEGGHTSNEESAR